jgi:hypothetical protein
MKSNLRFCRQQCQAADASAIGGYPLEPWWDVRDASPTPAEAAEARRTTTPWGAQVNLPDAGSRFWLLMRADCLRFLIPFVILPPPATAGRDGTKVVLMVHAVVEAEATRWEWE